MIFLLQFQFSSEMLHGKIIQPLIQKCLLRIWFVPGTGTKGLELQEEDLIDPLQNVYYSCCRLCRWIRKQHVNASYNRWWMAPACQSLTLWVFGNFIICPFLYSLQPSTYDKVASIPNDMGWAEIPQNHSAFRRYKIPWKEAFPIFSLPSLERSKELDQEYLLLQKIEREE